MVVTRREQIENVASVLFRERGYAATSVRDIAQAMNLQGGSLYAHVASKEDVLWSIVDRAAARFDAAATRAVAAGGSAEQRLRAMVRAHVDVVTSDRGNASVYLNEWRLLSDERRAAVAARRDAYERRFRATVEEGVASGEFMTADARVAATWILSALNGLATWYRPDGRLAPDAIAELYADLFVSGLSCPPSRREQP